MSFDLDAYNAEKDRRRAAEHAEYESELAAKIAAIRERTGYPVNRASQSWEVDREAWAALPAPARHLTYAADRAGWRWQVVWQLDTCEPPHPFVVVSMAGGGAAASLTWHTHQGGLRLVSAIYHPAGAGWRDTSLKGLRVYVLAHPVLEEAT